MALLQFLAVVLTALLLGTTFAHVLEMPAKMRASGTLWLRFQQTLYPSFATVGGPLEIGAIAATAMLAYAQRDSPVPFAFAISATSLLGLGFFAVWLGITNPVNARTAGWSDHTLPHDWMRWRNLWEYSHAARFVLHVLAFSALAAMLAWTTR